MSEITLGDLLTWRSSEVWVLRSAQNLDQIADRPVSWAVTIRPVPPALPVLHGNEIVIVPTRILEQLQAVETVGWKHFWLMLAEYTVAAVLVDDEQLLQGPVEVPVLVGESEFVLEAESTLNRDITRRRSELYRMGSNLARAFSALSLAQGGVEALLNVAEAIGDVQLQLCDGRRTLIARSRSAPESVPPACASGLLQERIRSHVARRDLVLSGRVPSGQSRDVTRLVLSQAAGALALLLDRGQITIVSGDPEREQALFIVDLVTGQARTKFEHSAVYERLPGLAADKPLRLCRISSDEGELAIRLRPRILNLIRRTGASLSESELIVIVGADGESLELRQIDDAVGDLAKHDPSVRAVISEPVEDAFKLQNALRSTRVFTEVARAGYFRGPVIRADDYRQTGLFGLLYPLLEDAEGQTQLSCEPTAAFATAMLAELEQYDIEHEGALVDTLSAFLEAGGSVTGAATSLGVHRNTLSYRINRIAEITGQDLGDAGVRMLFQVAITIQRLRSAAARI